MNHPSREEWMSYLYDESSASARADLQAHLHHCTECQANLAEWKAVRHALDQWRLPARAPRWAGRLRPVQWAAAAVVVLGVGFGLGRFAAPAASPEQMRAAIEPGLRESLRREFAPTWRAELDRATATAVSTAGAETRQLIGEFADAYNQRRTEDLKSVSAALGRLDNQRIADNTSMRRDMEKVALYADTGLRRTREQLVQLADYQAQPGANPSN
jgi:hypothetical protein